MTIFSDKELSQKLERTEARSNADFVETRARLSPESGAEWIEVAGACAMFDGIESPLTQTFGLGLFDEINDAEINRLEEFFKKHDAPVFHEVSPMADPPLIELLNRRGYQPVELTSVMFRTLAEENLPFRPNLQITTRVIENNEVDIWAKTAADGWSTEMPGMGDFMFAFCRIGAQCANAFPYIAELDGKPISTGALLIYDDIALLAGASTIPEGRKQGAQSALLASRLRHAAENGCKIAMMCAAPGSQSQKNAQKNGFQIAYTRIKWQLKP
ncbi:MAG: GNAT family N-acetyltransferase [Saprospiraceae bacterium]|nr:GNAT family N-acetyltransferase [Pyrinomonadaceae bacterium]